LQTEGIEAVLLVLVPDDRRRNRTGAVNSRLRTDLIEAIVLGLFSEVRLETSGAIGLPTSSEERLPEVVGNALPKLGESPASMPYSAHTILDCAPLGVLARVLLAVL